MAAVTKQAEAAARLDIQTLKVGDIIEGRYKYIDKIGKGAFGTVVLMEDTVVDEAWGKPAAHAAVMDFLATHSEFEIDKSREHHLFTLFPDGWLRRKA